MSDRDDGHDFRAQRLHVSDDLILGARIALTREQANYLLNVLRLGPGAHIRVFNGRDGEWLARVAPSGRRDAGLDIERQVRSQAGGPDMHYLFAPLKRSRLDYMVQKATELGAARLVPVITRYTVVDRVNSDRMRANVVEAAEQCGILRIPDVAEPTKLPKVLECWDATRTLVFCDEAAPVADPVAALQAVPRGPVAVLIGPEGGFSEEERALLAAQPFTVPVSLGPRIMRADTAAVAALALVNAVLGDWRDPRPADD